VTNVSVLDGHPLLCQPAMDAVKQWRYSTTLLNGEPVPVQTTVNITFKLSDETFVQPTSTPTITGMIGTVTPSNPTTVNPAVQLPRIEPVRVGGQVQETKIISKIYPVYPEVAKKARVEATVILEVTVNEQGEVAGVRVLRSHPLLEQAAIDAVKQWRYSPTILNGQPVPVVATASIEFKLSSMHVTLGPDGSLMDSQGQPISLQRLKESKDDILVTAGSQIPFAVVQSTLQYLQYQGIQNLRLGSTDYDYQAGRLFYTGPTITSGPAGLQTSSTNPSVQAPVLDVDMDHLASLAKASGGWTIATNGAGYSVSTAGLVSSYTLYVSETGEIIDVQGALNMPEIAAALRQVHVVSPGQKDGKPVPTRVMLLIRTK